MNSPDRVHPIGVIFSRFCVKLVIKKITPKDGLDWKHTVDDKKKPLISRQDRVLQQLQENAIPVAVYLHSGIKLQGQVVRFDPLVILLRSTKGITQMIFKHAILTVQAH